MVDVLLNCNVNDPKLYGFISQCTSCFDARQRLLRAHNCLESTYMVERERLSNNGPSFAETRTSVVRDTINQYCSVFNSSNDHPRFNYKKIFATRENREFHEILLDLRNKDISHMERQYSETFMYSNGSPKALFAGRGSPILNNFTPYDSHGEQLLEQLKLSHNWFLNKMTELREKIDTTLLEKSSDWFEALDPYISDCPV